METFTEIIELTFLTMQLRVLTQGSRKLVPRVMGSGGSTGYKWGCDAWDFPLTSAQRSVEVPGWMLEPGWVWGTGLVIR